MKVQFETSDLISALETFGERYHAVDVFADDLSESAKRDVERVVVAANGRVYQFSVFQEYGVVRFERRPSQDLTFEGMIAGAAIGSAIAVAARQRGEGVLAGALLGLLVGGALGAASGSGAPPTRKVFAMELQPGTREWVAYDGSMLRWMKDRLLPADKADASGDALARTNPSKSLPPAMGSPGVKRPAKRSSAKRSSSK